MSLKYGLEPCGGNVIEHRPVRCNRTQYAGQIVTLTALGSVATIATTATAAYGVLAENFTTTATEKTTKKAISVFKSGAKFRGIITGTSSQICVGTLADVALNTTSRYRINVGAKNQPIFNIVDLDSRDTATAGRRVIVMVNQTNSCYDGVGR